MTFTIFSASRETPVLKEVFIILHKGNTTRSVIVISMLEGPLDFFAVKCIDNFLLTHQLTQNVIKKLNWFLDFTKDTGDLLTFRISLPVLGAMLVLIIVLIPVHVFLMLLFSSKKLLKYFFSDFFYFLTYRITKLIVQAFDGLIVWLTFLSIKTFISLIYY